MTDPGNIEAFLNDVENRLIPEGELRHRVRRVRTAIQGAKEGGGYAAGFTAGREACARWHDEQVQALRLRGAEKGASLHEFYALCLRSRPVPPHPWDTMQDRRDGNSPTGAQDGSDLRKRIARAAWAIGTPQEVADAILAEIDRTHELVPKGPSRPGSTTGGRET